MSILKRLFGRRKPAPEQKIHVEAFGPVDWSNIHVGVVSAERLWYSDLQGWFVVPVDGSEPHTIAAADLVPGKVYRR